MTAPACRSGYAPETGAIHAGFAFCVEAEADRAALNESAVHTDFMVGGPEVEVDGQERGGAWIPILRNNEFQIK